MLSNLNNFEDGKYLLTIFGYDSKKSQVTLRVHHKMYLHGVSNMMDK